MAAAPVPGTLGIVAGGGALPGLLASACAAQDRPHFLLGLTGYADPQALGRAPDAWIRLGEAGRGFDLLKAAGATAVVMAGSVRRPSLADLRPDARTALFFARIAGRALGDDGLMRAVIAEIEREGLRVIGPEDVLADLVAPAGILGRHAPPPGVADDIRCGIEAAHALGRADAGQAVVVRAGAVVGREDEAGTAALIARCAETARGGVLVKMKKPQQDRRADLPVIGPDTIRQAEAAGLSGVAVEAGGCLILGLPQVRVLADAAGLFVIGVAP